MRDKIYPELQLHILHGFVGLMVKLTYLRNW